MSAYLPFARTAVLATLTLGGAAAQAQIDLSTYVRTGVFNLPSTTTGSNLLANEASAVTYNWDRDSLFVVGDGGTALVEVSKTGALIGSMTLTGFTSTAVGDPEGITTSATASSCCRWNASARPHSSTTLLAETLQSPT